MGTLRHCRLCDSRKLESFLDLGFTPPADAFLRIEGMNEPETYYPLEVFSCVECGHAQLGYVVPPETLYRHDYPYESSITKAGYEHWTEFAKTVKEELSLTEDDLVIDIGSNVGVLLECFKNLNVRILGVDPASNIVRLAEKRGIQTLCEFFGLEVAELIRSSWGKAKVITGTNVFAHVDDLENFMEAISLLLKDDGVFIFEAPHFLHLIEKIEYDTIYHEHLSYVSIKPLTKFFDKMGFEIFNVEQRDIHGGSIRVYIGRKGCNPIQSSVAEVIVEEEKHNIFDINRLREFGEMVKKNRQDLTWLLQKLKHEGKKIVAVSAPAKGMTLLNYCRLGPEVLDYCTEKSLLKIGRKTPGTHLEVKPDAALLEDKPDYALLLAWNFADEIIKNLKDFRDQGGKFIIPVPVPRIVE